MPSCKKTSIKMSHNLNSIAKVGRNFLIQKHGSHNCTSRSIHFSPKGMFSGSNFQFSVTQFYNVIRSLPVSRKVIAESPKFNKIHFSSSHVLRYIQQSLLHIPQSLKRHSVSIVRMSTIQCECVVAHKIRRCLQIFSLYTRLWNEMALKQFLKTFQQHVFKRGRMLLLSSSFVSMFNWEMERIQDEEILGHMEEIDYIHMLIANTMTCSICLLRQVINAAVANVDYCKCKNSTPSWKKCVDDWLPFIEGRDLLIWKKTEPCGMFTYKVYGNYSDVTANDFMQVQMDVANRKEWDPTVVELSVVDRDPDPNSNCDVVYWEMEWPRLFANRDYVYNRRFIVDNDKKIMLIVNQGTSHPSCPEKAEKIRVKEYWSFMVIRPYTEFSQPGIEFGLTYFDNPGIAIPSAVTAWVAMSGLPNFLQRLRQAAADVGAKRSLTPAPAEEPVLSSAPIPAPPTVQEPQQYPQPCDNNSGDAYFQQFPFHRLFI